jgi:uncharacterized protein YjiS (DUF1127 family)
MSTVLQERHQPISAPKLRDRPAQLATRGSQLATPRASVPAAGLGRPAVAPRAGWSLILDSIVATLREWHRRRVGRNELAGLDERTLRDIGLDPGTVDYEVRQSFWRPIRHWRD